MNYNRFKLSFLALLIFLSACQKENMSMRYSVRGYVQKGPFRPGTGVVISVLDNNLLPKGITYFSSVSDIYGKFEFPDVEYETPYVELIADGYFYNELSGKPTEEKLVLKAVTDLSSSSSVNINILTHISSERIKYLVQNERKSFAEAKVQAEKEIMEIFSFSDSNVGQFQELDISSAGEENAKLLVISSIFLCYDRQVSLSGLTEFLARFSFDIKEDGKLDSQELQENIATSAAFLDVGAIRINLNDFYETNTLFNLFPYYADSFNKNTEYQLAFDFSYLDFSDNGRNLLGVLDNSHLERDSNYFVAINKYSDAIERFSVYIEKTSETGGIEIQAFNNKYPVNTVELEDNKTYHEFFISSTEELYKIRFNGTGEGKAIFYVDLAGKRYFHYRSSKYFKW
jgi:hypothetical protein